MTDEQIIKALEYCSTDVRENTCPKCAFYKKHRCSTLMLNAVSDLINRQKAEIEQWKEEADRWQNAFCKVNEDMSTIKFEAIKEFAERLKHFIIPQKADGYTREIVLKRDIDSLVKEMTEER